MLIWEVLAALLVGGAVLWLVLGPLVRPEPARPELLEPEDPSETRRGQSLVALKELEFDREMGKLSDDDYQALRAAYTAEALAVLREEAEPAPAPGAGVAPPADAESAAEALIASRRGRRPAACERCGPRAEPDARFCSECGLALGAAACRACGAALQPEGRFCASCGAAAAAA